MSILRAEVSHELNAAGQWKVALPLTDPRTSEAQVGRVWRHYREGEGLVFAGYIENVRKTADGELELSGPTLLIDLLYENTLLRRKYDHENLDDILVDLLSGTGWTPTPDPPNSTMGWTLPSSREWAIGAFRLQPSGSARPRLDNATSKEASPSSGFTWTHECAGSNRILIVAVTTSGGAQSVTSLTHHGLALTKLGEAVRPTQVKTEFWYKLNPDTGGAWDIVLNVSGPCNLLAGAMSWRDVLQAAPAGFAGANGNTATPSVTVASAPGDTDVVVDGLGTHAGTGIDYKEGLGQSDHYLSEAAGTRQAGSSSSPDPYLTARFDGESILKAIGLLLEQDGLHFREEVSESGGSLVKNLAFGDFGASAGVIISGPAPYDSVIIDDPALATASSLSVEETSEEVWNRIIPLGGGDGTAQLTLEHATRQSPYQIKTLTGPDGGVIYCLEDSASVATYGRRTRAFVAKDVAPLSNTKTALQRAADALYDLAAAQLRFWKNKQTAYRIKCLALEPSVKPGDKVRLRWRGVAEHWGERFVYLDIDTELYVLSRRRRFSEDGTEESELVVSDIQQRLQTEDEVIVGKLENTSRAFRTHVQQSVSNYTMGPVLDSLGPAGGEEMTFDAVIDDNVTQLLRCRLRLKPRPIRSTAKGAASGGGQTSSQDTSHTHYISGQTAQSGGGQTSGQSGSHTHTVPGHRHYIGTIGPTGQYDTPVQRVWVVRDQYNVAADIGVGHYSGFSNSITIHTWESDGGGTSGNIGNHTHTVYDHTHTVSGVTSGGGSAHSHTVSNHTHSQVYGIYEGSTAAGLRLWIDGVDRTSELGGPWSAASTVDITQYLLDSDGVVVQGTHQVKITTTTLGRVEVYLDWTVVVQAIVAT